MSDCLGEELLKFMANKCKTQSTNFEDENKITEQRKIGVHKMDKYINADKFIRDLEDEYHGMISDESLKIYKIIQRLNDEPGANVEEVKYGEWSHLGGDEWCCTNCGEVITTEGSWEKPTKKYCNECGAKMDGGEEE